MLYVELDRPEPVIDELLPMLSHKQPKLIAATLNALTAIYHAFGCKTCDPKPVLKALPKVFGHADKNVRAEAQNLTVEFYRWLKESMKPLFWDDLKPVQQTDLDKLFEKVKEEPPPKQERLLRSQQAAQARSGGDAVDSGGDLGEEADGVEEAEDVDLEIAIDVTAKIPKDLQERLSSTKWKERKEALEELHAAINCAKIEERPFDEIIRSLAKCMKDANIAVVTVAANCIERFATGLRRSFGKYRTIVMNPMMERLKEKKQSVTDAIGAALDAVFLSTSLGDCMEEIFEFLKHKNPQVKLESTKFLIRCLRTTRTAPELPQVKSIVDASTKLLTESQETQRNAGAEVLGTLWKIMGDRVMSSHLDSLDEIRKTKVREYMEAVEVKAKFKPKAAPPPKPAGGPAQKKAPLGAKKPALGMKKPTPAPAAAPPHEEPAAPLQSRPSSRPGVPKLGATKSGLAQPGSGLRFPQKKGSALPSTASPKRPSSAAEESAPPATSAPPKSGLGPGARGGLAGRPLGKPAAADSGPSAVPSSSTLSGLSTVERAELEELRAEVDRLRRQTEDMRADRQKLSSQIHELQNQNAQLIEDHTRDVLSIKAKETQLVRARSDAEAAEQQVQTQQREIDRLKRELSRQVRATSPPPFDVSDQIYADPDPAAAAANGFPHPGGRRFGDSGYGSSRRREYSAASAGSGSGSHPSGPHSPGGEGKENMLDGAASGAAPALSRAGSARSGKLSSPLRGTGRPPSGARADSAASSGVASPVEGAGAAQGGGSGNVESWKRAAEVTQNLKARIEMMKVCTAHDPFELPPKSSRFLLSPPSPPFFSLLGSAGRMC